MIERQQEFHVALLGVLDDLAGQIELVVLYAGFSDFCALGLQEGVGHGAANNQGVDFVQQVLDDGDLVADFGAAEDGDKGLFGVVQVLPRYSSSFSMSRPAADFWTNLVTPTVEAWARCAEPKASLT